MADKNKPIRPHFSRGIAWLNAGVMYCCKEHAPCCHAIPFVFPPNTFYCGQLLSDKKDYTAEFLQPSLFQ